MKSMLRMVFVLLLAVAITGISFGQTVESWQIVNVTVTDSAGVLDQSATVSVMDDLVNDVTVVFELANGDSTSTGRFLFDGQELSNCLVGLTDDGAIIFSNCTSHSDMAEEIMRDQRLISLTSEEMTWVSFTPDGDSPLRYTITFNRIP